jgi:hypothetical protein
MRGVFTKAAVTWSVAGAAKAGTATVSGVSVSPAEATVAKGGTGFFLSLIRAILEPWLMK